MWKYVAVLEGSRDLMWSYTLESLCGWLATGENGESMRYTKSFSL